MCLVLYAWAPGRKLEIYQPYPRNYGTTVNRAVATSVCNPKASTISTQYGKHFFMSSASLPVKPEVLEPKSTLAGAMEDPNEAPVV